MGQRQGSAPSGQWMESMLHHGPGNTHNCLNSALCNGIMVMRSNPSEVKGLFEDTELCGKLLGRKSGAIVSQMLSDISATILEIRLCLGCLMGIQVTLEFNMGITGRMVNKNTSSTVHIIFLCLGMLIKETTFRRTDKMVSQYFLSLVEISCLEHICLILDLLCSCSWGGPSDLFSKLTHSTFWHGTDLRSSGMKLVGVLHVGEYSGSHQKLNFVKRKMAETTMPSEELLFQFPEVHVGLADS